MLRISNLILLLLFSNACSEMVNHATPASCTPNCDGRVCGTDGCGGVCGFCDNDQRCSLDGRCATYCLPDCTGRECGPDPVCGAECGPCAAPLECDLLAAACVPCARDCTGLQCGADPRCGLSCGDCPAEAPDCLQGFCGVRCVPNCENRSCGDDGCGESCGACEMNQVCDPQGQCVSG